MLFGRTAAHHNGHRGALVGFAGGVVADYVAFLDRAALFRRGGHLEACALERRARLAFGHAGNVRYVDGLCAARDDELDRDGFGHLLSCRRVRADDVAFFDIAAVFSARGDCQSHLLERATCGLFLFVHDVRQCKRVFAARDDQVHAGALFAVRPSSWILADDVAFLDGVALRGAHVAYFEACRTDGFFRLLLCHVHDVRDRVAGTTALRQAESNGCNGDERYDEDDDERSVAFLGRRFGVAVVQGAVIDALGNMGCTAHGGHDLRAVSLDRGHVRHAAAHDRSDRGREAAQVHRTTAQIVVQRVLHVARRGETAGRVFVERLHDDVFEGGVDGGVHLARRHRLLLDLLHGNTYRVGAVEGQFACGRFVQHDAERIDVGGVGELLALSLLRRHVVSGAQDRRGLGLH